MKTRLQRISVLLFFLVSTSIYAQTSFFNKVKDVDKSQANIGLENSYQFNVDELSTALLKAPERYSKNGTSNALVLEFPTLTGELERYRIEEASVMAPELQANYPEIRSYVGYGIDTPTSYLRFSISPYKGISGLVISGVEGKSLVINADRNDVSKFKILKKTKTLDKDNPFTCGTIADLELTEAGRDGADNNNSSSANTINHEFVLAMSVTGEYSQYHGGDLPSVNAAIVATVTRVNGVFENDFNVSLVLVANNDEVVYLDPNSDPYSGTSDATYSPDLQEELDASIGATNYDVGHLMAGIGNNGFAGCIGCICVNGQKGSGYTTSTVPDGDTFDIDFVAHEMGHQFGANHTFTHNPEGPGIAQMEVGSGSTIMGYAGITGPTDVQSNSDPYFHAISIQQVTGHVSTRTCDVETTIANNIPVADAGADLILPIGTPFRLTGSATDADAGDALTYCWEQFDENNGQGGGFPDPSLANSNLPLFRSYLPKESSTRTFPLLEDLVDNGVNGSLWEKIPNVGRSADFRLTVRDNKPGGAANDFDDMTVTWDATKGPLMVTSQDAAGILWTSGSTETITWDVNNTNTLAGATNVDILLSTDGGLTYPTTLVSGVANNGSAEITVPNTPAPYCRVMVQPSNAPFFSINTVDFAIDFLVETTCTPYSSADNLGIAIPDGGGANVQGTPIFNSLNIPDVGVVDEIKVSVDVSHTYIGDLIIQIQDPLDVAFTNVWARDCNTSGFDNIDVTFDDNAGEIACATPTSGTYAPNGELSTFNGVDYNGDWQIILVDFFNGDTGTLNSWGIELCSTTVTQLSVDEFSNVDFSIYPNPNNGEFTVKLNSASNDDIEIEVFDIGGRRIFDRSYTNNSNFDEIITLNNVQSGMYLVNVTDGQKTATKKIVIE